MEKKKVIVVIPVYRSTLKSSEATALAHNLEVLKRYPTVFLKPEGLDLSQLCQQYPQVGEISVSNDWLGTKRGIDGYNDMTMSSDFTNYFPTTNICSSAMLMLGCFLTNCLTGATVVTITWQPRGPHDRAIFTFLSSSTSVYAYG